MTTRSCGNCQWAELIILPNEDLVHECRRWPPQLLIKDHDEGEITQCWPQMDGTDWCAEHTPTDDGDPT